MRRLDLLLRMQPAPSEFHPTLARSGKPVPVTSAAKQIPPVTSILAASAKPSCTGTPRTTAPRYPCASVDQSHRHTSRHLGAGTCFLRQIPRHPRPIPPAHERPRLHLAVNPSLPPPPSQSQQHPKPNPTGTRTTAPRYRCAPVDPIPPARGLQHLPSPRGLVASAEANPTLAALPNPAYGARSQIIRLALAPTVAASCGGQGGLVTEGAERWQISALALLVTMILSVEKMLKSMELLPIGMAIVTPN